MSWPFSALAVLGGLFGVVVMVRSIVKLATLDRLAKARMRELEQEMEIAARQAAEVAKERSVESVARDLDRGEF